MIDLSMMCRYYYTSHSRNARTPRHPAMAPICPTVWAKFFGDVYPRHPESTQDTALQPALLTGTQGIKASNNFQDLRRSFSTGTDMQRFSMSLENSRLTKRIAAMYHLAMECTISVIREDTELEQPLWDARKTARYLGRPVRFLYSPNNRAELRLAAVKIGRKLMFAPDDVEKVVRRFKEKLPPSAA